MAQTKEECLVFLNRARDALDELSLLNDQEKQLNCEERQLEQSLNTEKKLMNDSIQQTLKKRREEINSSYDKELDKSENLLKKARNRREKAKNEGVKERIANETSALKEENRDLRTQLKTMLKRSRVPAFCRTPLYYHLYFPRLLKEYVLIIAIILAFFLALPLSIYLLIPDHKPFYLAIIYPIDILLFGGSYIIIGNRTKVLYRDILEKGRDIQDHIFANNRKIKSIISGIYKDKNESLYDLKKFDDEIARLQQELVDVSEKKTEALNTFETVTKNILIDEIEHNYKEKLDKLQQKYEQVSEELKSITQQLKEKRLYITDHYGTYLGKEFLDSLKIVDLCAIIQNDQAANISEAINVYQAEKSQNKNNSKTSVL